MSKITDPLGEKRFVLARISASGNHNYIDMIKGNKSLKTEADATAEARQLAALGSDCFVLEVKKGFGRKLMVTELEITTD